MKKILIVHAHPESQSFCATLKNTAKEYFLAKGNQVQESDLYAMNFSPIGNKNDFKQLENEQFFKYQMEQVHAFKNNLFSDELKSEMEKLEWCDVLIFSFPLWWFGLPAILKGWVDRVFAMGFVYGAGKGVYENGVYQNKKAFITITTGGPMQAYGAEGKNGNLETILFPIHHGMFYFTGMTVVSPFVCYSPARISNEERANEIARYQQFLENLDKADILYSHHLAN